MNSVTENTKKTFKFSVLAYRDTEEEVAFEINRQIDQYIKHYFGSSKVRIIKSSIIHPFYSLMMGLVITAIEL